MVIYANMYTKYTKTLIHKLKCSSKLICSSFIVHDDDTHIVSDSNEVTQC